MATLVPLGLIRLFGYQGLGMPSFAGKAETYTLAPYARLVKRL